MLALRLLWRIVKIVLSLVVGIAVVGVIWLLVLKTTNPKPVDSAGWELGLAMPEPRGESASALVDGQLIVIGGLRGTLGSVSADVSVLDLESGSWKSGQGLQRGVHHAAAAAVDKDVYLSGGARSTTNWEPVDDVLRLRPGKGWDFVATMPEGRQGHAMVSIGDKLYIVGGVGTTDDTLIYDISDRLWTRGAPLPGDRNHLRAIVRNGHVWALGGRSGKPTGRVDVYYPEDDEWKEGLPLPEPMSAMAVGVIDDDVHVVGSEDPSFLGGGVSSSHYVFRAKGSRWKQLAREPLGVHGAAYGVWDEALVVAGGAARNGALSVISWTDATQLFTEDDAALPNEPADDPPPEDGGSELPGE
jgi:N-acetylneuraminic acid mutarotase